MNIKILVIGIVKNGNSILLRKKPDGSLPYKETWYLFGGEITNEHQNPEKTLIDTLKKQTGIKINPVERIGWDTEIKKDHDGEEKFFIYLDYICEYVSGELQTGEGIERLEWAKISKLDEYDLVPPSKKLFKKLGYL